MIDCILKIVSNPPKNKYDFDTELNSYSMIPVIQWLSGVLYGIVTLRMLMYLSILTPSQA